MSQKRFLFHIYSLIILTSLMKKYLNSLLHEYNHIDYFGKKHLNSLSQESYQKFLFGLTCFNIHIDFFLNVPQKTPFFKVIGVSLSRYCRFRQFLEENHSSVTSVIRNISYHAVHHWKALEEEISNILLRVRNLSFLI